MSRPSWGHTSRHCTRCGAVGPRIQYDIGWVHLYCLTAPEKTKRRKEMEAEYAAARAKYEAECAARPKAKPWGHA